MIKPEPDGTDDVIVVNDLTKKMLQHLKEHMAEEPTVPSGDDRYLYEERAAMHYEWSRTHQAIRLLIGVQLVNQAIEQL